MYTHLLCSHKQTKYPVHNFFFAISFKSTVPCEIRAFASNPMLSKECHTKKKHKRKLAEKSNWNRTTIKKFRREKKQFQIFVRFSYAIVCSTLHNRKKLVYPFFDLNIVEHWQEGTRLMHSLGNHCY